jgi:hypothetical protein
VIETYDFTLYILFHELGHANDPENVAQLSAKEKLDLWLKLATRCTAKDRLNSQRMIVEDSHQRIVNRNYSKLTPAQRLSYAKEYYAELCATAFSTNGVKDKRDWEIVETVIKRIDPEYDWESNSKKRLDLTDKL